MLEIEVQSCDLDFFLREQNSDHAWIKPGKWRLLNVETIADSGSGHDPRKIAWLIRTINRIPETIEVMGYET